MAWLALVVGIVASLLANVAAAEPTLEGRLVAAWPPLALAMAFELLMQQTKEGRASRYLARPTVTVAGEGSGERGERQ